MAGKGKKYEIEILLDKVPEVAKEILVGLSQSHPVVMAIFALSTINAIRMLGYKDEEQLLTGLYIDVRNLGIAAAVAPVVAGGFAMVKTALEGKK